ncbi:Integral membrane protein [Pleurostoma richardsiae]|uniref:Integral membrane protein n=1 Tax=Pleurostoma richardsiae TaxID=41990 RepID=A0AA38RQG7_9PEZI|nr:Integral membrane protein [Pleurostoma richardsiae]
MAGNNAGEGYNQRLTIGIVVTCLTFSILSFGLRLYARVLSAAKLWYDDYWMVGVMAVCISMSASDFIGLAYGSGRHEATLDTDTVTTFMKNLYVYMLLWSTGVFSVKIGILLFYWRVFPTRDFRIGVLGVAGLSTGIFLSNFFTFMLQCSPVKMFWLPKTPGKCIDQHTFYFASAIINVVGDVAVLSLPLPVVWRLHTSRSKKWSLSFLFLLGLFVCVASVFRIIAVNEIDPEDFTFSNVGGGLWSTVEVEIGFICANLPAIRPLVNKWLGRSEGSSGYPSHGTGSAYAGASSKRRNSRAGHMVLGSREGDNDLEMMTKDNASDETSLANRGQQPGVAPKDGKGFIHVRTDVEMTVVEQSEWDKKRGMDAYLDVASPTPTPR